MSHAVQSFPVSKLRFVGIDLQQKSPHNLEGWFSVSVPADEVPVGLADLIPDQMQFALSSNLRLLTLRTKLKPALYGVQPESRDLLPLREFCLATGCTMDRLLRDKPGWVAVVIYEKSAAQSRNSDYPDRFGLSLEAIRVDGAKIEIPTWENLVGVPAQDPSNPRT